MAFGKAKPPAEIAWRPDFRIPERLPDIKPVRTDFFINFAAITFCLIAVVAAGFQEYTIYNSYSDIDNRVTELKNATSEQETLSNSNTSFAKTSTFLKEFVLFSTKHLNATDLFYSLNRVTPRAITLEGVRQSPVVRDIEKPASKVVNTQIILAGYIREADTDKASVILKQFKDSLFQSPEFKGKIITHVDDAFVKDGEKGIVKFTVRIEITSVAASIAKLPTKSTP